MKKFKSAIAMGDLGSMATALVIIGITIGIGVLIMSTMQDTSAISPTNYANETVTLTNGTYTALAQPRGIAVLTVSGNGTATDATSPTYLLGNFTMVGNRTSSAVLTTGFPAFNSTTYYVYYSYQEESDAFEVLDSSTDSVNVFGDWLVIIAIVIVAVVVLTLIKYL